MGFLQKNQLKLDFSKAMLAPHSIKTAYRCLESDAKFIKLFLTCLNLFYPGLSMLLGGNCYAELIDNYYIYKETKQRKKV